MQHLSRTNLSNSCRGSIYYSCSHKDHSHNRSQHANNINIYVHHSQLFTVFHKTFIHNCMHHVILMNTKIIMIVVYNNYYFIFESASYTKYYIEENLSPMLLRDLSISLPRSVKVNIFVCELVTLHHKGLPKQACHQNHLYRQH